MEKLNNLKSSFSRNEEFNISKEVKENALASEGKSYADQTQEPQKINMRVTTSQYEVIGKNQICSVKTFFSRA